jgi:hypothetical protein
VDYSLTLRKSVATTITMHSICGPAPFSRHNNTNQDSRSLNAGNDTSSMVEPGIASGENNVISYHQVTTVGSSIVPKSSCVDSQLSIAPRPRSHNRLEDTGGKTGAQRAVSVVSNGCTTVGIKLATSNARSVAVGNFAGNARSITATEGEPSVSAAGGKRMENLADFVHYSPPVPHQSDSTVSTGGPSVLVSPSVIAVQQSRSKRKLVSSSDYVPIKKEKQDDGYEQPLMNASTKPPVACNGVQPVSLSSGLLTDGSTATSGYIHHDLLSTSLPIVDQSVQHNGFRKATVWWPTSQQNVRNPLSASRTPRTETVVSSVLATAVTQLTNTRHQSSQPKLTLTTSNSSVSRKLPTVVSLSNMRRPVNHSSAQPSASSILALSRKVKSYIGKSFGERYVAPLHAPPELCLPPPRRYICSGCGNEYITLAGMQSHLSRQSMVLTFKNGRKLSTTRALWRHFIRHTNAGLVIMLPLRHS